MGYGDLSVSESTEIFLCFYIIVSIVFVAYAIGRFTSVLDDQKRLKKRTELLKQMQSLDFIAELNDGQGVGKHEFVLAILGHLGVLDKEKDIDPWLEVSAVAKCINTFIYIKLFNCSSAEIRCLRFRPERRADQGGKRFRHTLVYVLTAFVVRRS